MRSFKSKIILGDQDIKDTLYYWYNSIKKLDSLKFVVRNNDLIDTISVKLRNSNIDSLKIKPLQNNYISFLDECTISS